MATITASQFDLLRDFVMKESAIVLEPGKEYLVESRLAPIARREGLASVGDLVQQAVGINGSTLRTEIIDAMTTNETSFFRDVHPWQTLREHLLPELIAAKSSTKQLTIWCAACSSGQEPYTLAMVLREHFPELFPSWKISIIATDLSDSMLKRTREGRYSQLEVNRGLPAHLLVRWFRRDGASWVLTDDIRNLVDVRFSNLSAPSTMPAGQRFDLVFVRNVLIYFDEPTKRKIVNEVADRMSPTSFLLLGSSEVSANACPRLTRDQFDRTVFFRVSGR